MDGQDIHRIAGDNADSIRGSFLTNYWYPVAWSEEVDETPFGITLCGNEIILLRGTENAISGLSGICPHRFASLSSGKRVSENRLQCPYHGLEFSLDGRCVANPHGAIPKVVRLKAYIVVERHSIVWVWHGDSDRADAALIPDCGLLEDVQHRTVRGRLKTHANYELITDNLMDLTHVSYVHAGGIGSDAVAAGAHQVIQQGTTIFSNRWCADAPAPPVWGALFGGYTGHVDHWLNMRWDAPATMLLDVGITPAGGTREDGITVWSAHLLAPETDSSTHYLFAAARDFALSDDNLDGVIKAALEEAFVGEDRPLLEQIERNMKGRSFDEMRPLILPFDEAAVRARRMVADFRAGRKTQLPSVSTWFGRQVPHSKPL